jgi:hypothetical protein
MANAWKDTTRAGRLITGAFLIVALVLAGSAAAEAAKPKKHHHPRCPKGQVKTSSGCKTPLAKFLITLRSSSHLIAAQLAPNADGDSEIVWNPSVAYPYQHPCTGPALTGALATQTEAASVKFTTKNKYVGTAFSGSQVVEGGSQDVTNGVETDQVTVSTTGKVNTAKTVSGTVTISEKRGLGPSLTSQTYTSCGSTFKFKLTKYTGAFPGPASVPSTP